MSGRGSDDVESYRRRKRQDERQRREEESSSPPPPPASTAKRTTASSASYENDRESRMARLRREMEEEDMEMREALDQRKKEAEEDKHRPQEMIVEVHPDELEGLDEEEQMRKLMGIQGFGTTKGKAVQDNQNSAARGVAAKNKARKYRQYMNRKNGFNRPLEKMN
eukprot:scaffold2189_cov116-Cylindrotheca_fusiformis.AAC.8